MLHTPLRSIAGFPIIVCCRNVARSPREAIVAPALQAPERVSVLLCCAATPVAPEVVNSTEVCIVANNSVTVLNYRFAPTCAQILRDIPTTDM